MWSEQTASILKTDARDIEVDVRTNIWCDWFHLELIGTLTGKDADVAARLAVQQEFYEYRSMLQLRAVEYLKTLQPCPFKPEQLEMLSKLEGKNMEHSALRVLSVLKDWLTMCVYALGSDATRRCIAHAIDKAYSKAVSMTAGKETQQMMHTKSVCTDEMFSIIDHIQKQREKAPFNGSTSTSEEETSSEDSVMSLDNTKVFDISYRLREHIHSSCKAAAVDAMTAFAEATPSIRNPILQSTVTTDARISANDRNGYYNIQYRLQCRGRGVEAIRRRMREHRDVTQFLLGTRDPFNDIAETDVFSHGSIVYEQVIVIPKPSLIHIGILNEGTDPLPEHPMEVKGINGVSSKLLTQQKSDPKWIIAEITLKELNAFLIGMSEYLCNDLGLKGMHSASTHPILFPVDNPLRLRWKPDETVMELVKNGHVYQKSLTVEMIQEIEAICDGLIQKTNALVDLAPPLPLYLSNDAQNRTSMLVGIAVVLTLMGSCLGIFYRTEVGHLLNQFKKSMDMKIAEVRERSERS